MMKLNQIPHRLLTRLVLTSLLLLLGGCDAKPPERVDNVDHADTVLLKEQMRDLIQAAKSNIKSVDNLSQAIENLHRRVRELERNDHR